MAHTEIINVMGVNFLNLKHSSPISWILNSELEGIPVRFINVHSLANRFRSERYSESINSTGINFADGFPIVLWSHLKSRKSLQRIRGFDFFLEVATSNLIRNRQVFIVPNSQVADTLPFQLLKLNAQINLGPIIVPPVSQDVSEILLYIQSNVFFHRDDIVWVALGGEKQDLVSEMISPSVKAAIGIGAAINFFSGEVRQCPRLLSRIGLEWIFRLLVEPKRLWRRYLFDFFTLIRILKTDLRR